MTQKAIGLLLIFSLAAYPRCSPSILLLNINHPTPKQNCTRSFPRQRDPRQRLLSPDDERIIHPAMPLRRRRDEELQRLRRQRHRKILLPRQRIHQA